MLIALASVTHVVRAPATPPSSVRPEAGKAGDSRPATLMIPVPGIPASALVDTFNQDRGGGRLHHAIDIMAARGTPVRAAAAGQVEKLFDSMRGGHTVYIRSPDGRWQYYYAHLDSYAADLREGKVVPRGQVVAAVGSTGDADAAAPHLHFEVHRMAPGEGWWQGTPVDPYPLLAGRGPGG